MPVSQAELRQPLNNFTAKDCQVMCTEEPRLVDCKVMCTEEPRLVYCKVMCTEEPRLVDCKVICTKEQKYVTGLSSHEQLGTKIGGLR